MLKIIIGEETYDEETHLFGIADGVEIELEHSLISLSKWESKFEKPFLSSEKKSPEEIFGYIDAMIITPNIDPDVLQRCSDENLVAIQEYIDSKQSATTFGHMPERRGLGEVITSELIYFWMSSFSIPFECQYWHLNRLFSLIRICNVKNSKPEKKSRAQIVQERAELNAKRRAELNTSG